jgi:hypothetical protein
MGLRDRLRAGCNAGNIMLIGAGITGLVLALFRDLSVPSMVLAGACLLGGVVMWLWPDSEGPMLSLLGLSVVGTGFLSLWLYGWSLWHLGLIAFGCWICYCGVKQLDALQAQQAAPPADEDQPGDSPDAE